jgi:hypothetical protein
MASELDRHAQNTQQAARHDEDTGRYALADEERHLADDYEKLAIATRLSEQTRDPEPFCAQSAAMREIADWNDQIVRDTRAFATLVGPPLTEDEQKEIKKLQDGGDYWRNEANHCDVEINAK